MSYRYSLRLALDPGWTDEDGLADLPELLNTGRIDDVMVFANVEELNTGHTTLAERAVFRDLAERTGAVAAACGASLSINPWHTVMHGDYGKKLRAGQDFQLMVDPRGRRAELAACPRDLSWREYLSEIYAFYATTQPQFLWVEDDFRYHNHPPLEWGGCFCDEHLAEFSRRAGRPVGRDEFVAGLLAPGEPHRFRAIWLDTAREALEETAASIEQAVHAVSPHTRLGLMTSLPMVHAAEGRRWEPLLRALSGPHRPAVRVHLPAYAERRPADYLALFHAIADGHRALLPADAEVFPELENFPYSRFSKSLAFTRFQLLGAQVLAPSGMTLDFYDLNGTGPVLADRYQDVLAQTKDELDAGLADGFFARPRAGVAVMINEDSAASIHTAPGCDMEGLYPREYLFGALLAGYGIPFRYCTDSELSGEIIAVSGQYFRTVGADAATALLERNRAIVDAEAVEALIELGLAEVIGADRLGWVGSDDGVVTYEETEPGVHLRGRRLARASVLLMGGEVGLIDYRAERVRPLTRLRRAEHAESGIGHVLVDDRILVMPFGRFDPLGGLPPMLRTTMRQELLQQVLASWDRSSVFIRGAADVVAYQYPEPTGFGLYLVNGSFDALERPRIRVGDWEVGQIDLSGEPIGFSREGDDVLLDIALASLDAVRITVTAARQGPAQTDLRRHGE